MKARFEIKFIDVTWYDKNTILSIKEIFNPLKIDYENEIFVCNTVIYPMADGIKLGQLAFRYLQINSNVPYFEALDGARILLKKIIDKDNGNEWWIEANYWMASYKRWDSRIYRTAGKVVVKLHDQICQINIGSSEFTASQLDLYLSDFKSDLWELILDERSYVTGKAKKIQDGGISEESINLICSILEHAQKIINNPKAELREVQILKSRRKIKPVNRTFMELATKSNTLLLTSRATTPSYNIPENRYILFVLERLYIIIKQLVIISKRKEKRFEASIINLNSRYTAFKKEKLINKDLVFRDYRILKKLCNLDYLNNELIQIFKPSSDLNKEKIETWHLKVGNPTYLNNYYFLSIKKENNDPWFETKTGFQTVFIFFRKQLFLKFFEFDFEYKIEAEIKQEISKSEYGTPRFDYEIVKISSIKILGGKGLENRKRKLDEDEKKGRALELNGWVKKLNWKELNEQDQEKYSINNQIKAYEVRQNNAGLVHGALQPKLLKIKNIIFSMKALKVKPLSAFPNSMTFVQNPSYQAVYSGYKSIRNITNLNDEDLLLSLEKVEEIGLIDIPLLYERWCLLQIIKVLIYNFNYIPNLDWKHRLLAIISTKSHDQCLNFSNATLNRSISLMYEPTLSNGKRPDFVMDVFVKLKDDTEINKRFVMDAKYYSYDLFQVNGGISKIIKTLYLDKNYSEDGKNSVFILHPATNIIGNQLSPQSWGENSFLGEVHMFDWDKPMRKNNYHQYGAICANPVLRLSYLDELQRLIGMFLQYGIEDNKLKRDSDDVLSSNFCIACGSHELTKKIKNTDNKKSIWYECNDCKHFTTYNHCHRCNTRLIKNGDYWTYHSQMPMEPLNIKCPACESLV